MRLKVCVCLTLIGSCWTAIAQSAPSRKDPTPDPDRCFELRDSLQGRRAPALYRGILADEFNEPVKANTLLRSVIANAPTSPAAREARKHLVASLAREGGYRDASLQIKAALAIDPHDSEMKQRSDLVSILSQKPDLAVTKYRFSKIQYERYFLRNGHTRLLIPVSINGKAARYVLDTGANISVMSESEAKSMGLEVNRGDAKLLGSTGVETPVDAAFAKEVRIGSIEFRNVWFAVYPDAISGLPPDHQGLIGLPLLIALRTLRWNSKGGLEVGFSPSGNGTIRSNVCFVGNYPYVAGKFENTSLQLLLDTGETQTELGGRFATQFPGLITQGKPVTGHARGAGGSTIRHGVELSEIRLRVGGRDMDLKPAYVVLQGSVMDDDDGTLGIDHLLDTDQGSLDFKSMLLSLK